MITNERKGFTLIEILIVVAIIAILASVVLVGLGPTQQAGRDARRLSDLHETQNALELYYNKCGYYPGTSVASPCAAWAAVSLWSNLQPVLTGSGLGISQIPNDPTGGKNYFYGTTNLGTSYIIAATMEQGVAASIFRSYNPPAVGGYTIGNLPGGTCAAPTYCTSL